MWVEFALITFKWPDYFKHTCTVVEAITKIAVHASALKTAWSVYTLSVFITALHLIALVDVWVGERVSSLLRYTVSIASHKTDCCTHT